MHAKEPLALTEDILVSDSDLKKMAGLIEAANPPPYVPRELKIISTRTGGYGLIVAGELVGLAESDARLGALVSNWARTTTYCAGRGDLGICIQTSQSWTSIL
jgi:hypothetical protein